jgi:Flp pilus assembly pilin Flp
VAGRQREQSIMIRLFIDDERGMETLEYAVIAGLLAVLIAFIYSSNGLFMNTLRDRLQNAGSQS